MITVQMMAPVIPTVVKYLLADEKNGTTTIETAPVMAWLLQHDTTVDEVKDHHIVPGVLNGEWGTIATAEEVISDSLNTEIIGVYPVGVEPSQADIDCAVEVLTESLRRHWHKAEQFPEPHRDKRRASISRTAHALKAVAG